MNEIINNKWVCSRCEKPNAIRKSNKEFMLGDNTILRYCKCGRLHSIKIDKNYNIISHNSSHIRHSRGTPIKWKNNPLNKNGKRV